MSFPPEETSKAAKPEKPMNPFVKRILGSLWDQYDDQIKSVAMTALDGLQTRLPDLLDKADQWIVEEMPKQKPKVRAKLDQLIDEKGPQLIDAALAQFSKTLHEK